MMNLFNKTIFSIFGMTLLATGFVACSSDDNSTTSTETTNEGLITTMSTDYYYQEFEKSLKSLDAELLKRLDEYNAKIYLEDIHSTSLNYILSRGFSKQNLIGIIL